MVSVGAEMRKVANPLSKPAVKWDCEVEEEGRYARDVV